MDILEDRDAWYHEFEQNWLKRFNETGETHWKIYNHPRNQTAPEGKAIDLSNSRLVLITSAGGYLKDSQEPYDAENLLGDYSIRTFPRDTPLDQLAFAHTHYDHTAVNEDTQVLVPLRHLENLVEEGVIGELAPTVISFMGYQPNVIRVIDETIPVIQDVVRREQAHGALLVPS